MTTSSCGTRARPVRFRRRTDHPAAVAGVSFSVSRATTVGIVGESGSGKSSTGNAILGLVAPSSGSIRFDGVELVGSTEYPADIRRNIQAVFQNPGASLDPTMLVDQLLAEPLRIHGVRDADERRRRIEEALELVNLAPEHLARAPHEFSGGQRQRIAIARSLILRPELLVLDEAVSALDASTRSQVLNLLRDLQEQLGIAYVFISHDLELVSHMSHEIVVMFAGRVVESGPVDLIARDPVHPYTRQLWAAAPSLERRRTPIRTRRPSAVAGSDNTGPAVGCAFQHRCPLVMDECRVQQPPATTLGDGRTVECFLAEPTPTTARSIP